MGGFCKEDREYLASKGLCCSCGKNPATPGYASCQDCRDKVNARQAIAKEERSKKNLCIRCGKRPPTEGFKTCNVCRAKYSKVTPRIEEKRAEVRQVAVKPLRLCHDCKKVRTANYRCAKCQEKFMRDNGCVDHGGYMPDDFGVHTGAEPAHFSAKMRMIANKRERPRNG